MITFNKSDDALTVFADGEMYTVPSDSPNFKKCWECVKEDDIEGFKKAVDLVSAIGSLTVSGNGVEVDATGVYYNGNRFECNLTERILDFMRDGVDTKPLVKFLERFLSNPSITFASNPEVLSVLGISQEQARVKVENFISDFWSFLNHRNLPICEDGCFLAYKTVRADFLDKYTGKIDNSVGKLVKVERESVDPDRNRECSHGLHVGCLSYAGPGGWYNSCRDKVVIVKVAPENVVAVPPDHNRTKMRVCEYEVIAEYKKPLEKAVYSGTCESEDLDEDVVDSNVDDSFTLDDVHEEDTISFDYTKSDGTVSRRHLFVEDFVYEDVFDDDEGTEWEEIVAVLGKLVDPEEDAGEWRRFNAENISNIRIDFA